VGEVAINLKIVKIQNAIGAVRLVILKKIARSDVCVKHIKFLNKWGQK
jgi:hypothetical protein